MDLEEYRLQHRLTYEQLAVLIGASQKTRARAYALGEAWPRYSEKLAKILKATKGLVTIEDMHARRMAFLRAANAPRARSRPERRVA